MLADCVEIYTGNPIVEGKRRGRCKCASLEGVEILWSDGLVETVEALDPRAEDIGMLHESGDWSSLADLYLVEEVQHDLSLSERADQAVQFLEDALVDLGLIEAKKAPEKKKPEKKAATKKAVPVEKAPKESPKAKDKAEKSVKHASKKASKSKSEKHVKAAKHPGHHKLHGKGGKFTSSPLKRTHANLKHHKMDKKTGKIAPYEAPPEGHNPDNLPGGGAPTVKQVGRDKAGEYEYGEGPAGTDKKHSPFKRTSVADDGPPPGTTDSEGHQVAPPPSDNRAHGHTGCWDCHKTEAYKQKCKYVCDGTDPDGHEKGDIKYITIKPSYKKNYNKAHKSWNADYQDTQTYKVRGAEHSDKVKKKNPQKKSTLWGKPDKHHHGSRVTARPYHPKATGGARPPGKKGK